MADENTITTVFRADISQFSASTQQLNQYVRIVNSEFNEATAGMGRWSDSADGLNAKITQLNKILEAERTKLTSLEKQYDSLTDEQKKNTVQGQKLAIQINNQRGVVKKTESQIDSYETSLNELTEAGVKTKKELNDLNKSIETNGSKAGSAASSIAKGLGKGLLGIGGAVFGAAGSFLALGESTREFRKEQGQLEASFVSAGHSAETANKVYADFNAVLGDTAKTTESMQQLAQFAKTEKELTDYTHILTGAYATFGNALPTEGLAEGINHTIQLGEVQGTLADALEWSGVSVEDFNDQLANCNTEEERSALIQKTLNGLYGEAADHYKENNKDLIDAERAQTRLTQAMADLGAIAEPIVTMMKSAFADLLETITPFVQLIGEGLVGAFQGSEEGAQKFAEGINGIIQHVLSMATEMLPNFINIATSLFPILVETLAQNLPIVVNALAQGMAQILNALSGMLPTLIPVIIDAILLCVETIIDNLGMLIDAGIQVILALAQGLIDALPSLIEKIPVIIGKLVSAIASNLPKLIAAGIELTLKLAVGLVKAIPDLIAKIPEIISNIVSAFINDGIPSMLDVGKDLIKGLWEGIKNMGSWLKEKIEGFGKGIVDGFKKFFGIESPSKLFEDQIGKNLALGIGEGFEDEMGDVNKQINSACEQIKPKIDVPSVETLGSYSLAQQDSLLARLSDMIKGNTVNNYNISNKFERMETTQYALHKSNLELKRILKEV